jgi:trafficking protein particle complex subunit 4
LCNDLESACAPCHELLAMQVFQTLTGIKFLLFVAPGTRQTSEMLRAIYELYSDYVMKDPYYELEQRIKSETLKDMLRRKVVEFEAKLSAT